MTDASPTPNALPPPRGMRLPWRRLPAPVRASVEDALGTAVVDAESQPAGFSPGVAARLTLAGGRRVFAKAVGPYPNPDSTAIHRREAQIVAALPPGLPAPRLLHVLDEGEGGWVTLVLEDIDGAHPREPWQPAELNRVLGALVDLSETLTPSPLTSDVARSAVDAFSAWLCGWRRLVEETPSRLDRLDPWSLRNLDALIALERNAGPAVAGDTLLHCDVRADNILLSPERVWFVDWPHAHIGAAWVDVVLFAPSVTMQGGPPPEDVAASHPAYVAADADSVTAAVVALAGFFTHRSVQPPPPGLPTLRAFQAAQAAIAREWVAARTGLT